MPQSVRVATVGEIPPGTGKEVVAGDAIVAVFNCDGQFHALDGICPHSGGPLAEGQLTGCTVTCPWHGWQFNVRTGVNCLNPRMQHTNYPVRVDGADIIVELP